MPKEYVDDCWGFPGIPFRVKVGWGHQGNVQIATVDPEREDKVDDRKGGLYVTLDRQGVNSLIRILRKARDQAFGRDE